MKKMIKKSRKKFKRWCKKHDLHSDLFKFIISHLYRFYLLLVGKSKSRKKSAMKIMKKYLTKKELRNPRIVNKYYNDILFCRFYYGTVTREYFSFDFKMLSHEARKTYLTRNNKYPYYKKFNNPNYTDYLNKKTETYAKFKEFYGREVLCMYDKDDFDAFVEFVGKHDRFIYKPADDYGGHGVKIYDSTQYDSLQDLFDIIIINGFCVIEELIVQADPIAALHPQSVNTMRVVAFITPTGKTKIQWCFLRMGMGGSHTDNMSSGGLAIMVDPKTGIAFLPGRDWLGAEHIFHPDTGIQLVGFQIPEWDSLLELIDKLAHVIPQIHLVGWDLAYTDKGWVFVEGNARPQCVSAQLTNFNGKLHLYKKMNTEYNKAIKRLERRRKRRIALRKQRMLEDEALLAEQNSTDIDDASLLGSINQFEKFVNSVGEDNNLPDDIDDYDSFSDSENEDEELISNMDEAEMLKENKRNSEN